MSTSLNNTYRVSLEDAFILHSRPYSDTSRLLDIFTRTHGRITLIAKGARSQKSKLHGILQLFIPLLISWSGKGEVQTLTAAESVKTTISITGTTVMCAFYMNELLQRMLTKYDPHPELYDIYHDTLLKFSVDDEETNLRRFEKLVLQEVGYGLNLHSESVTGDPIVASKNYIYDADKGASYVDKTNHDEWFISGQTLIDLAKDTYMNTESKNQAKQLMRKVLQRHLGDKPLKTRALHWYKPL